MESCVLHPPNSRLLSGDVIGGVLQQRSRRPRHTFVGQSGGTGSNPAPRPAQHRQLIGQGAIAGIDKHHQNACLVKATACGDSLREVGELIFADKLRLREQRRARQMRYRKKKQVYASSLDEVNRKLREETQQLEQRRRRLPSAATRAGESSWSVVVKYFRLFQYGVRESMPTPSSSESQQMAFLLASVAPDVTFNTERGAEAIMTSWRRISRWFPDMEVELDGVTKDAARSFLARTTTTVTISEQTLRNAFPHLWLNDRRGERQWLTLAEKIVGQRIVMRGSTQFEWDSAVCRVRRVASHSDMLTPMLTLLGSLENVSRVFDKALVTMDFHCKK
ncbi:hypothetical protein PHYPSEUDO_015188 [Phytophthora pseudosyringae]|uniref:Bzip transcription factor n=1 Tax=Phytophthora pseudosyringae TaxID=221518 RepID=A0A8T1V8D2_9STRA|nr:hypothetical protein PHYPSEUDO_015188 [Phytophthora pseudosyringae]